MLSKKTSGFQRKEGIMLQMKAKLTLLLMVVFCTGLLIPTVLAKPDKVDGYNVPSGRIPQAIKDHARTAPLNQSMSQAASQPSNATARRAPAKCQLSVTVAGQAFSMQTKRKICTANTNGQTTSHHS